VVVLAPTIEILKQSESMVFGALGIALDAREMLDENARLGTVENQTNAPAGTNSI
jgi:hypothetical protein